MICVIFVQKDFLYSKLIDAVDDKISILHGIAQISHTKIAIVAFFFRSNASRPYPIMPTLCQWHIINILFKFCQLWVLNDKSI